MFRQYINDNYGSKRGLIETGKHRILYHLGKYDKYKVVNWDEVERLVFVCKGNICRSAFAEAVAKTLAINAISCGIDSDDGKPADDKAIQMAAEKGFELGVHRTRKLGSLKLQNGDLLVVMEPCQASVLNNKIDGRVQVTLMGLWGMPVIPHIYDPFGLTDSYFCRCFNYIQESTMALTEKVKRHSLELE